MCTLLICSSITAYGQHISTLTENALQQLSKSNWEKELMVYAGHLWSLSTNEDQELNSGTESGPLCVSLNLHQYLLPNLNS